MRREALVPQGSADGDHVLEKRAEAWILVEALASRVGAGLNAEPKVERVLHAVARLMDERGACLMGFHFLNDQSFNRIVVPVSLRNHPCLA